MLDIATLNALVFEERTIIPDDFDQTKYDPTALPGNTKIVVIEDNRGKDGAGHRVLVRQYQLEFADIIASLSPTSAGVSLFAIGTLVDGLVAAAWEKHAHVFASMEELEYLHQPPVVFAARGEDPLPRILNNNELTLLHYKVRQ